VNGLHEMETLVEGVGRIRDVAIDADGELLLLIENADGSKILRMNSVDTNEPRK